MPSLTSLDLRFHVMTLTLCVVDMAVFEYQNQVIFNMIIFDGGPSLS
jgi:hypothetical protein